MGYITTKIVADDGVAWSVNVPGVPVSELPGVFDVVVRRTFDAASGEVTLNTEPFGSHVRRSVYPIGGYLSAMTFPA